jgi:hypothetical protein
MIVTAGSINRNREEDIVTVKYLKVPQSKKKVKTL